MVEMDVAPTADGRIAVFHDWTARLPHRRARERARLHDGAAQGARHRLRLHPGWRPQLPVPRQGRGGDADARGSARGPADHADPVQLQVEDPGEARTCWRRLLQRERARRRANGRCVLRRPRPRSRGSPELFPKNWAWSKEGARACSEDYVKLGWSGYLPESCRGGTMIIPLDQAVAVLGLAQPAARADGSGRRTRAGGRPARQRRGADGAVAARAARRECLRPSTATCGSRTSGRSGRRCGRAGTGEPTCRRWRRRTGSTGGGRGWRASRRRGWEEEKKGHRKGFAKAQRREDAARHGEAVFHPHRPLPQAPEFRRAASPPKQGFLRVLCVFAPLHELP